MKQSTRKILFLLFILIFTTATPLTIMYASGYKLVLTWPIKPQSLIQKTGMFILETLPRGAKVFVNNKPAYDALDKLIGKNNSQLTTPVKIKNLLPGDYEIRLELAGYWPWQKKLTIKPGMSTIIKDIYLLKKKLPVIVQSADPDSISVSNDYQKTLASLNNEYLIIDNKSNVIASLNLFTKESKSDKTTWSRDGNYLLLNDLIIEMNSDKRLTLADYFGDNYSNLKWSPTHDSVIYFESGNTIKSFNLITKELKVLSDIQFCCDFFVERDSLYLISYVGGSYKLKKYSINDKILQAEISLPYSSSYKIIGEFNGLLNLIDAKNNLLYLIDYNNHYSPLKEILANVKYYDWTDTGILLYANDFELWKYDLKEKQKKLLTRISKPITAVFYHNESNYALFTTNNSINFIETEANGRKNITELVKLEIVTNPSFDNVNKILYFGSKIGSQSGLFKLEI